MKKALCSMLAVCLLLLPFTLTACSQPSVSAPASATAAPAAPTIVPAASPTPAPTQESEPEAQSSLRLSFDTQGLEELTPGSEYMLDGLLYFSVEKADSVENSEEAVLEAIKTLEGTQIRLTNLTPSEEHSPILTYPAWLIVYDEGDNEDTRHCVDLYVQTDTADFRLHTSVPVDYELDYHDEVGKRLATVHWVE